MEFLTEDGDPSKDVNMPSSPSDIVLNEKNESIDEECKCRLGSRDCNCERTLNTMVERVRDGFCMQHLWIFKPHSTIVVNKEQCVHVINQSLIIVGPGIIDLQ